MSHPTSDDVVAAAINLAPQILTPSATNWRQHASYRHRSSSLSPPPGCSAPSATVDGWFGTPAAHGVSRHRSPLEARWLCGVVCHDSTAFSLFAGWLRTECRARPLWAAA